MSESNVKKFSQLKIQSKYSISEGDSKIEEWKEKYQEMKIK